MAEQPESSPLEPQESMPPGPPPLTERRSWVLTVGLLLIAVVLATTWIRRSSRPAAPRAGNAPQQQQQGAEVGRPAPDFVLKDIHGSSVRLADFKGKVVIVDFWATWCQPCEIMIPWLIEFRRQYGPQGLEIVGIAMDDEGASVVKPFAERKRMNYPVVLGNEEVADRWGGIFGLPTTFVIDRQGRIHARHFGRVSREVFEKDIKSLL